MRSSFGASRNDRDKRSLMVRPLARAFLRRFASIAFNAAVALALTAPPAAAENAEIARRRAAERKAFTDAEIVEGFFKLTFGAEFQVEARADRVRKFDAPVRVFISNRAKPDRSRQVAATVADIGRRIQHLDIAVTRQRGDANAIVRLVHDRDLAKTLRSVYGRERARSIQKSLEPQCLSSFARDDKFRIARADVILVADAGDFIFYDCAYEELLQALGPINDDSSVQWSMFNDKVHLGFFGVYDQYILNMLYHPLIRPGMTRTEVRALLPTVLPQVRAFVAKINGLPP
jgi:hypothetical protein